MQKYISLILVSFIFGLLGGFLGSRLMVPEVAEKTQEEWMTDFYAAEMATVVSPTAVKRAIDNGDDKYILVDLRSQAEYAQEHFMTAVNIPAVSLDEAQLVAEFEKLPKDKEIIVHCYSAYCTLGRQVGNTLSKHGIYVKELTVGWSELRYHYDLWNPGAMPSDGDKYIVKGDPNVEVLPAPCVDGEFGC